MKLQRFVTSIIWDQNSTEVAMYRRTYCFTEIGLRMMAFGVTDVVALCAREGRDYIGGWLLRWTEDKMKSNVECCPTASEAKGD